MVEAIIKSAGISHVVNAMIIVTAKEMGMAFFAGMRKPTSRTAADKMGVKANSASSVDDIDWLVLVILQLLVSVYGCFSSSFPNVAKR